MEDKDKIWQEEMQQYKMPAYNTQQGWEKLQHKMQNKKAKKFYFLKASAAAVLLLAMGFYAGRYFGIKKTTTPSPQWANTAVHLKNIKNKTIAITAIPKEEKKKTVVKKQLAITKKINKPIAYAMQKEKESIVVKKEDTNIIINKAIVQNTNLSESAMQEGLAVVEKPKSLRIISINEIDDFAERQTTPIIKEKENILMRLAAYRQANNLVATSKFDGLKIKL